MLAATAFTGDWIATRPSANDPGGPPASDSLVEAVIGAAVLVTTAFRLRDEAGLMSALQLLTKQVDGWELAASEAAWGSP